MKFFSPIELGFWKQQQSLPVMSASPKLSFHSPLEAKSQWDLAHALGSALKEKNAVLEILQPPESSSLLIFDLIDRVRFSYGENDKGKNAISILFDSNEQGALSQFIYLYLTGGFEFKVMYVTPYSEIHFTRPSTIYWNTLSPHRLESSLGDVLLDLCMQKY